MLRKKSNFTIVFLLSFNILLLLFAILFPVFMLKAQKNTLLPRFSLSFFQVATKNNAYPYWKITQVPREAHFPQHLVNQVIVSFLQGPTKQEQKKGITSFVPAHTRLLSLNINHNLAYINLSSELLQDKQKWEFLKIMQSLLSSIQAFHIDKIQLLVNFNNSFSPFGDSDYSVKKVFTQKRINNLLAKLKKNS